MLKQWKRNRIASRYRKIRRGRDAMHKESSSSTRTTQQYINWAYLLGFDLGVPPVWRKS